MENIIKTKTVEISLVKREAITFLLIIISNQVYVYYLNGLLNDENKLRQKVTAYLNLRIKGIDVSESINKLINLMK